MSKKLVVSTAKKKSNMSSNPNMTYEELHDSLIPILMVFASKFDPIELPNQINGITDEAIDEIVLLFATLCTEVMKISLQEIIDAGLFSNPEGYEDSIGLIKLQENRLAQLTTKNTEEKNV